MSDEGLKSEDVDEANLDFSRSLQCSFSCGE